MFLLGTFGLTAFTTAVIWQREYGAEMPLWLSLIMYLPFEVWMFIVLYKLYN